MLLPFDGAGDRTRDAAQEFKPASHSFEPTLPSIAALFTQICIRETGENWCFGRTRHTNMGTFESMVLDQSGME